MKKRSLLVAVLIALALLTPRVSQGTTNPFCASQGKDCGLIDDGHGGKVDCGPCTGFNTCGGGGIPNVCGCTPKDCTGVECGEIDRGCGLGKLQCGGNCTSPNTCGGGGTPNVCGCTPKTCAGLSCGSITPGCGLPPQSCGQCNSATDVCKNNVCCTPRTCAGGKCGTIDPGCGLPLLNCGPCCTPRECSENACGMTDLGCGVRRNCGGCPGDMFCSKDGFCKRPGPDPDHKCPCGGHWPNACQICEGLTETPPGTPALCVERGKNCGLIDDGHGKKVNCGTCKGKETCGGGGVPNVCGLPKQK